MKTTSTKTREILDLCSQSLGQTLTLIESTLSSPEQFRAAKKMLLYHHHRDFLPALRALLGEDGSDCRQLSFDLNDEPSTSSDPFSATDKLKK